MRSGAGSADIGNIAGYGRDLLRRAQGLSRSSLHRRTLHIHGLHIDAWFSDPAYADLCERNLAPAAEADGAAQITLFLLDAESLGWSAPRRWGGDMLDRHAINEELARAGLHGAYLHDPRVWQFFSGDLRLGVQLIRRPGATPLWETGGPLRVFLHWAFAGSRARLCHTATLGLDGRGVLLAGAGGSGKSGTTLAGIVAGLATVGDDYGLVAQEDAVVAAYPLYRILKQDPAGVMRVMGAEARTQFGRTNWQDKFEIHVSALARSPFVGRLEIGAILLPRVARLERTELRSVSSGAAMRAFAPSSVFQLPDGEREGIGFAAELCRRLPCYELLLSENAVDIGQALRSFLERMPS